MKKFLATILALVMVLSLVACATDTDSNFANDTDNAIIDGAYQESYTQSAPSFVLRIDGIKELNANS